MLLLLFLVALLLLSRRSIGVREETNVFGQPLEPCSVEGMPTTGYTRSGRCETHLGDAGKHHVCVDISQMDFCGATGQSNWCQGKRNWCVCQWAFAEAVRAVGCANVNVVCDATNMRALEAYTKTDSVALQCLRSKCGQASASAAGL